MIKFNENILTIDKKDYPLQHNIKSVIELEKLIIILFDPIVLARENACYPNLRAFNKEVDQIWVAEQPTTMSGDYYFSVWWENGRLLAYSWRSYDCIIDINTGKIISKEWTK